MSNDIIIMYELYVGMLICLFKKHNNTECIKFWTNLVWNILLIDQQFPRQMSPYIRYYNLYNEN